MADQKFSGGLHVALGSLGGDIVEQYRLAKGGGLGEADVARDGGVVDQAGEVLAHLGRDLLGQVLPHVDHAQEYAFDAQAGVERTPHQVDGGAQVG